MKKILSIILVILMLLSVMPVSVFASSGSVEVTIVSQQGLFENVTKSYRAGDVFELTLMWRSDAKLYNNEIYTMFNNEGLKVVSQELNTKVSDAITNISDSIQAEFGEVMMSYSNVNGIKYSALDYLVKYKVEILPKANANETIAIHCEELNNVVESSDVTDDMVYVTGGTVVEENRDHYQLLPVLGESDSSKMVDVKVTSQQGLFGTIHKTYEKGDIFDVAVMWQSEDLFYNAEIYTHLDCDGLRVISETISPKISGSLTNISEDIQMEYEEVIFNFSNLTGADYTTKNYIVKYKVQILETADTSETLSLYCYEANNIPTVATVSEDAVYITNGGVIEENRDRFSMSVILGEVGESGDSTITDTTNNSHGLIAQNANKIAVKFISPQSLFAETTKIYRVGEIFEVSLMWQSDSPLRNIEFYTYLNSKGLKVVSEEINGKITNYFSNISETVQEKYGEVNFNFTAVNGCNYLTSDYVVKYRVEVLSSAASQETLTFYLEEGNGISPDGDPTKWIPYISKGYADSNYKGQYAAALNISEPVDDPEAYKYDYEILDDGTVMLLSYKGTENHVTIPSTINGMTVTAIGEDLLNGDKSIKSVTIPESVKTIDNNAFTSASVSFVIYGVKGSAAHKYAKENGFDFEETDASIKLNKTKKTLKAGKTYTVKVKNTKGKKVKFTSGNKKVATVNKKTGKVTALNQGTAVIKAKVDGKTLRCTIKVKTAPKLVDKKGKAVKTLTISKGKTATLYIKGKAKKINNKVKLSNKIAQLKSKKNQATVKIKGVKKGRTTLTVKVNKVKTFKVDVKVK